MNILMVSDVFHPRVNGVSTSIASFRNALHGLGHSTTLLAPAYPARTGPDHSVVRIASRCVPRDPEDRLMRMRALRHAMRSLGAQSFDLVHVHTPFLAHWAGTRLGTALGVPVVETYHTFFEEYFHHYLPALPRAWLRLAARSVSRRLERGLKGMIVPSQAIETVLRRYGLTLPIRVIPTGLDLSEFSPGDRQRFCRLHGLDPTRPTLVYVGRVAHEKNIGFLLEVVARLRRDLPDVLLVIAGEGPARTALQDQARKLDAQSNVAFIGYLQRGQPLWDCYAAGDAFVFASRTETQGLVLLEALALGVPVVAIAELGTGDVLRDCRGALLAAGDPAQFAATTLAVLRDSKLRAELAAQAPGDARRWSITATTHSLLEYYAALVEDPIAERAAEG
jgi:1,2-diacylglycerol 3-alpha-glucosyltransferase